MSPCTAADSEFLELPQPRGGLAARTLAMPADTNPAGDIFGGWIMSLMDAGAMTATGCARGRVVTAAVSRMSFLQPVKVGDAACCYTELLKIGCTPMTLGIKVGVLGQGRGKRPAAEFIFVAPDETGRPCPAGQIGTAQPEFRASIDRNTGESACGA